jgi:hypothetical protein
MRDRGQGAVIEGTDEGVQLWRIQMRGAVHRGYRLGVRL